MIREVARVLTAYATRRIAFDIDLIPLRCERLTFRAVTNWALTEGSVRFKPSHPWGLPTILQIEPTARCNLHCRACPVAGGLGRAAGDMPMDLYRRLVDEVRGTALVFLFWDWGEPLLHPEAYEMIRYARQAGIRVVCSTNGHVVGEENHARGIVASGLDVLIFSIDGLTQETYQSFRTGGSLARVVSGLRRVIAERRRLGATTPTINLRFIVTKENEHELPRVADYARDLGVDVLTLRKFHHVPGTEGGAADAGDGNRATLVPTRREFQLPVLDPAVGRPVRIRRNPCRNLWNCPTIHWDGTVCSCFMDYREARPLGSLQERSLREIWTGPAYAALRRAFREDWRGLPLCGDCSSGFAGGDVGREANAAVRFFDQPGEALE
jgi:MoaA/NifB/PqqE/SkfB family radical SAM enzyme